MGVKTHKYPNKIPILDYNNNSIIDKFILSVKLIPAINHISNFTQT